MKNKIYTALKKKIQTKSAKVAIIGLGYVGLPLAIEFSLKGIDVIGFDISEDTISKLKAGKSYLTGINDATIKKIMNKNFVPTTDPKALKDSDFIIICVPTPLEKDKTPDLSYIKASAQTISKYLKRGHFVILESTTFPGTTEDYLKVWLEEKSGLKCGSDFGLAFSPERVDPGNIKYGISNTPKVVGGITKEDTEVAAMLYDQVIVAGVIPVSNSRTAESTKLMENIFRHVNIALVNEMALVLRKMDIDVREVISAASSKPFGFMPFHPGPGVGGHCIPLDPYYLSFAARHKGMRPQFIELSGEINDYMKIHTVNLVETGLKESGKTIRDSIVGILGLAYKKDISDVRESPALEIIPDLSERGATVKVYDPFVNTVKTRTGTYTSERTPDALFKGSDAVILVTDHTQFQSLNYDSLIKKMRGKLLVDTRNCMKGIENKDLVYLKI
jgi:UDP-N-acetyl-D-glucosamine dehydrogenase